MGMARSFSRFVVTDKLPAANQSKIQTATPNMQNFTLKHSLLLQRLYQQEAQHKGVFWKNCCKIFNRLTRMNR
jgi:hypothetical protein